MRVSWALLLASSAATILAVSACSAGGQTVTAQRANPGGQEQSASAVPVTTATAAAKPMPIDIRVIGTAEAHETVAVRAQITGALTSVGFKEGDDVREGQVLFTLDKRPLQAALQQAEATLTRDTAQAANARAQAKRYQDLSQRGIATREQVDTTSTAAAALDATVGADRAAVENARVQLLYATIVAPISGRTGQLMVNAGNLVRANDTTPLVIINKVSPLFVSFAIPEAQMSEFKRYMAAGSVRVEASPPNDNGPAARGRITFVDNSVDQTTGTIKLKAEYENADRRLWPGQFVNVVITLSTEPNAIVVPSVAVQTGQQGQYVYVVKPDRTVDLRTVVVARVAGNETVIGNGLKAGDTVVTDGQLRLMPGSRVTIKEVATKATP
jgi:membrane fusion protein, multidrug efflux system